jgi:hypothetical protein
MSTIDTHFYYSPRIRSVSVTAPSVRCSHSAHARSCVSRLRCLRLRTPSFLEQTCSVLAAWRSFELAYQLPKNILKGKECSQHPRRCVTLFAHVAILVFNLETTLSSILFPIDHWKSKFRSGSRKMVLTSLALFDMAHAILEHRGSAASRI